MKSLHFKHKKTTNGKKEKKPQVSNRKMDPVSSLWQGMMELGALRTTSVFIHMGPRQERIKTQFENFESRPGALVVWEL